MIKTLKKNPLTLTSTTVFIHLLVLFIPLLQEQKITISNMGAAESLSISLTTIESISPKDDHKKEKTPKSLPNPSKTQTKKTTPPLNPLLEQTTKTQKDTQKTATQAKGRKTNFDEVIKHYTQPRYPRLALKRRLEGEVELEIYVDKKGGVNKVVVLQSSGHSILDNEALRAAKRWRFHASDSFVVTQKINYILRHN